MSHFRTIKRGSPTPTPTPTPTPSATFFGGMNMSETPYWRWGKPFNDYMHGSDEAWYYRSGGIGGSRLRLPEANLDGDRWPKSLPVAGSYLSRVLTYPTTVPVTVTVSWTGNPSDVQLVGNVTELSRDMVAKRVTYQLNSTVPADTTPFELKWTFTDTVNYPKNITVLEAGTSGYFAPKFLTDLGSMLSGGPIRFMKWTPCVERNGLFNSWDRLPATWATRNTITGGDWFLNTGVPVEVMVALANYFNVDAWFSFPWNCEDAYITNFATYVRNNLNSGLKAYYECSNEIWNGAYDVSWQARGNVAGDFASSTFTACCNGWSVRHKQMMTLVDAVYSGVLSKRVRCMGVQNAQPTMMNVLMDYTGGSPSGLTADWVDACTSAKYVENPTGYDATSTIILDAGLAAFFSAARTRADQRIANAVSVKAIATSYGKSYITYEDGQSFQYTDVPTMQRIMRSSLMYDFYIYLQQQHESLLGTSPMINFVTTSPIGSLDGFGVQEYQAQTTSKANTPKLQALVDYKAGIRVLGTLDYGALSVAQNAADGTSLGPAPAGKVSGTVYSLSNNDGGRVSINSSTGVLSVADHTLLTATGIRSATVVQTNALATNSPQSQSVNYTVISSLNNTTKYRWYRLLMDVIPSNGGSAFEEFEIAAVPSGADTTLGLATTSSSVAGANTSDRAIDDNTGTAWLDNQLSVAGQWWKIDYGSVSANQVAANEFRMFGFGSSTWPTAFRWQGSNDDSAWTDIKVVTGDTYSAGWRTFTV